MLWGTTREKGNVTDGQAVITHKDKRVQYSSPNNGGADMPRQTARRHLALTP